eukprot:9045185-Pyramimonas_sp.AAC.1
MQEYFIRWSSTRGTSTGELGTISGDGGALKWGVGVLRDGFGHSPRSHHHARVAGDGADEERG